MSEVDSVSIPDRKTDTPHPSFLPSATPTEFLPPMSRWTTVGGIVLVSLFSAVITLAGILKYKVAINASATIRPSGELRLVQASINGTIKKINVRVNQVVKKGDIIAYVDNLDLKTKKSQLQTSIQLATQQLSHLDAQIQALNVQIASERDRTNRAIISASAELNRNQRDVKDQRMTSTAQVREAQANYQQAQKELQKTQLQLRASQANLKFSKASFQAAKAKRDRYQPLAKNGSISQDQFQEVELAVEQQQQLLESQKANVEEHKQAIQQQQQAVVAAAAKLQAANSTLNPSDAIVTMSKEKIAVESAIGKVNLAKLNQEREQLLQQKVEIQKQLSRDGHELQQVNQEIASTVIRASASGIIQELNLRNTSQVLHSGDLVAQIVPHDSPLIVKALVEAEDIRKVKKGQDVQIRVFGCSYADYGTLPGKVMDISPDVVSGSVPQAFTPQSSDYKGAYYQVTIQPERLELNGGIHKCAVQAGMGARADILSSEETVLQLFLRKARLLTDL